MPWRAESKWPVKCRTLTSPTPVPFSNRSRKAHKLAISLTDIEERLVFEMRTALGLALDDIVEAMRRCTTRRRPSSQPSNLALVLRCLVTAAAQHRCAVTRA